MGRNAAAVGFLEANPPICLRPRDGFSVYGNIVLASARAQRDVRPANAPADARGRSERSLQENGGTSRGTLRCAAASLPFRARLLLSAAEARVVQLLPSDSKHRHRQRSSQHDFLLASRRSAHVLRRYVLEHAHPSGRFIINR